MGLSMQILRSLKNQKLTEKADFSVIAHNNYPVKSFREAPSLLWPEVFCNEKLESNHAAYLLVNYRLNQLPSPSCSIEKELGLYKSVYYVVTYEGVLGQIKNLHFFVGFRIRHFSLSPV